MRKVYVLITLLLFLCGMLLCFMVLTSADAHAADTAYAAARQSVHRINSFDIFDKGPQDECSSTAIGPHALLTAGHCLENSNKLSVDGKLVKIMITINDGNDHAILLLDGITFEKYATVVQRKPEVAEEFVLIGEPGDMRNQFRRGYVTGNGLMHVEDEPSDDNKTWFALDMNIFVGDSGAGLFDSTGKVITTSSFRKSLTAKDTLPAVFMGVFEMAFTQQQLDMARGGQ